MIIFKTCICPTQNSFLILLSEKAGDALSRLLLIAILAVSVGHFVRQRLVTFINALVQLVDAIVDQRELLLLVFVHVLNFGEDLVEYDVHVHRCI